MATLESIYEKNAFRDKKLFTVFIVFWETIAYNCSGHYISFLIIDQ